MIKKALIFCLILCVVYTIITGYYAPTWSTSQHQEHSNFIKAEKYIHQVGSNSFDNVIIGSSLSARIVMEKLPENFHNLSFLGGSIHDGLEIIKNTSNNPKRIFIETNNLFVDENEKFVSSLLNPVLCFAKTHLRIFRSENQPIGIFGNYRYVDAIFGRTLTFYRALMKKILPYKMSKSAKTKLKNRSKTIDFMFQQRLEHYSNLPDESTIRKFTTLLSEDVSIIEQRNIQVIFFEMPVSPNLSGLKKPIEIRNIINKHFVKNQFIPQPDCKDYKTTDGTHLIRESAITYAKYFKEYFFTNILFEDNKALLKTHFRKI